MGNRKTGVAVLGATGSVGQKMIELLNGHPWFELKEVGASERSAGKKYSDAVNWILASPLPEAAGSLTIKNCSGLDFESRIILSCMDASVAGEIEEKLAAKGHIVISNSRNHRFGKSVPLVIPEVNPGHLEILKERISKGAIVTNPICSTIGLVMALKPLHDKYGIESVNVVTMQALSGAGYPGVSSLDIIDNVIPYISGEEEKLESEPLKILGSVEKGSFKPADFKISAQCNRVAVIDGHLETVQVKLKKKASREEIIDLWNNYSSIPQALKLPSAPERPLRYFEQSNYPQPKIHRNLDKGMAVSIGRLRECPLFDFRFVIISHNTIRGAAGGTILNAELIQSLGYL
jgi:aspartate-semialdehyde dehydrogenase